MAPKRDAKASKADQPKQTGPEAMDSTGQEINEDVRMNQEEIQTEQSAGESTEIERLCAGADAKKKREEKEKEEAEKEIKKKAKKAAEKKQRAEDQAKRDAEKAAKDAEKKRKEAKRKADEERKKEEERLLKEKRAAERDARARRRAERVADSEDEQPKKKKARGEAKKPGKIFAALQGVGLGLKAGVKHIGKAAKAVVGKTCLAGEGSASPQTARTPPSPVTFSFIDRAPVLSDTELLYSEYNGHDGPHNYGYSRGSPRPRTFDLLTFSSEYDVTARTCDDPCPSPQSVTSVVYAPQPIYVSEEQRRRNEEFAQALRPDSAIVRKLAQWAAEEEEEELEEEARRQEKKRKEAGRREKQRQHEAGAVKAALVAEKEDKLRAHRLKRMRFLRERHNEKTGSTTERKRHLNRVPSDVV